MMHAQCMISSTAMLHYYCCMCMNLLKEAQGLLLSLNVHLINFAFSFLRYGNFWVAPRSSSRTGVSYFCLKTLQQAAYIAMLFFNGFFITRDGKKLYTYTNSPAAASSFLPPSSPRSYSVVWFDPLRAKKRERLCVLFTCIVEEHTCLQAQ